MIVPSSNHRYQVNSDNTILPKNCSLNSSSFVILVNDLNGNRKVISPC